MEKKNLLKTFATDSSVDENIAYIKTRSSVLINDSLIIRKSVEHFANFARKDKTGKENGYFDLPEPKIEEKPLTDYDIEKALSEINVYCPSCREKNNVIKNKRIYCNDCELYHDIYAGDVDASEFEK